MGSTGSTYVHATSINITKTFNYAEAEAQINNSLAVVFIDEIDTMISKRGNQSDSPNRDEERGTFLSMLESARNKKILVIAATNHLDRLDPPVIRPGRFDYKIHIPLPDQESMVTLLNSLFEKTPIDQEIDFCDWGNKFAGKSISDLKAFSVMARPMAFQQTVIDRIENPEAPLRSITQEMLTNAFEKFKSVDQ